MKSKSSIQISLGKTLLTVLATAILALVAVSSRGASASELLEKGIYAEETKGELKAASEIYQQIVADPAADRALVAQAQLRLGLCQLKLGNKPQAISALDRLTQEFPDKERLLAIVGNQMPQLLNEMLQQIEQNYIKEIDRSELMETAIRAIIGKLDSRATGLRPDDMEYLAADQVADLNTGIEQKFAGIGAVLKIDDTTQEVAIQSLLPDSPGLRAGLRPGDRILKVDGVQLPESKQLKMTVDLLRGKPGSLTTVGIKREGVAGVFDVQVVRDTVRLPSINGIRYRPDKTWDFMLDDQRKIGYIRLTQVGKRSPDEIKAALTGLKQRGFKALILDLRDNPGGVLDGAIAIADLFLESGRIVTVKGRNGESAYDAHPEGTFSGFATALLVNRHTASAAEIIAAALQDHHRALVVGERTFGQGIVRTLLPLKGGAGALKLPVAAYYRPSGKNVNRYPDSKETDDWGVQPDSGYELTLSDDELKQHNNERLGRELLNPEESAKAESRDRQLQKAIDCVVAQLKPNN